MTSPRENILLFICVLFTSLRSVDSIYCYQCSGTDSDNPFECNEFLPSDVDIQPIDCANIHDAQYCIKQVGRNEGVTLECFQCNSSTTMECGDGLMKLDGGILIPTPCDHVHEARYCIKLTGGITTKRYCSSLDIGNYCNYVGQPGDKLEYRTCIYTCGSDGCNSGNSLRISAILLFSVVLVKLFAF